jgi:hypothetical protein
VEETFSRITGSLRNSLPRRYPLRPGPPGFNFPWPDTGTDQCETADLRASALRRPARGHGGLCGLVRHLRASALSGPAGKSQEGDRLPDSPLSLSSGSQTTHLAINRFNKGGLEDTLREGHSLPKEIRVALDKGQAERLHQISPSEGPKRLVQAAAPRSPSATGHEVNSVGASFELPTVANEGILQEAATLLRPHAVVGRGMGVYVEAKNQS